MTEADREPSDPFRLRDRVMVVTGGTSGIGRMIATGFAAAGARVYIVGRNRARTAAAAAEIVVETGGLCRAIPADLTELSGISAVTDVVRTHEDAIHTLVNNAGIESVAPLDRFSETDWDTVLAANLKAPFFLVQSCLDLLQRGATSERPAAIINIGSVGGLRIGPKENYSYAASKSALHHITGSLAKRLGPDNIIVNAVAPGFFRTELTKGVSEESLAQLVATVPRRRIGSPADIIGLVGFLSSAEASYVTGSVIPLAGGMTL